MVEAFVLAEDDDDVLDRRLSRRAIGKARGGERGQNGARRESGEFYSLRSRIFGCAWRYVLSANAMDLHVPPRARPLAPCRFG